MKKEIDFNKDLTEDEEQYLLDNIDSFPQAPEWVSKSLRKAANSTPIIEYSDRGKKKPVTLRLSENDIKALKSAAIKNGLAYQSLITSILHKYVNGLLVDMDEAKKIFNSMHK